MEPLCKNCRWWSEKDSAGYTPTGPFRECTSPKLGDRDSVPRDGEDLLRYQYGEGGGIETGPEFGCVHFAESPDEN